MRLLIYIAVIYLMGPNIAFADTLRFSDYKKQFYSIAGSADTKMMRFISVYEDAFFGYDKTNGSLYVVNSHTAVPCGIFGGGILNDAKREASLMSFEDNWGSSGSSIQILASIIRGSVPSFGGCAIFTSETGNTVAAVMPGQVESGPGWLVSNIPNVKRRNVGFVESLPLSDQAYSWVANWIDSNRHIGESEILAIGGQGAVQQLSAEAYSVRLVNNMSGIPGPSSFKELLLKNGTTWNAFLDRERWYIDKMYKSPSSELEGTDGYKHFLTLSVSSSGFWSNKSFQNPSILLTIWSME